MPDIKNGGNNKKMPLLKGTNPVTLILLVLLVCTAVVFKLEADMLHDEINRVNNELAAQDRYIGKLEAEIGKNRIQIEAFSGTVNTENTLRSKMAGLIPESVPEFKLDSPIDSQSMTEDDKYIYEQNVKRLQNIFDYGAAVSAEYIVPDKDKGSCVAVMSRIKDLSDEICADSVSESEKACSIAMWVSENIYYDRDAAIESVNLDVISLENVLALKRTTCAGYSNLFSALCQAQGICCINMRGGVLDTEGYTLKTIPKNHEWNAAYCDGEWLFFDTTWSSLNVYTDEEYVKIDMVAEEYINMDFSEMSVKHRIDTAEYRNFYQALFEI